MKRNIKKEHCTAMLSRKEEKKWRAETLMSRRVTEGTKKKYTSRVKRIMAEVGGLDYKDLVSYLRNKQVKASTKRGDIAAVSFWLDANGEGIKKNKRISTA